MDVRNSQLIVLLVLVFAAIVSVAAYIGFRNTAWHADLLEQERQRVEAEQRDTAAGRNTRRQRIPGTRQRIAASDETHTVRRLRELLEHRTTALKKQNAKLARAGVEHAKLQAEYDQLRAEYGRLRQQADWQLTSIVSGVWQTISDDSSQPQTAVIDGTSLDDLMPGGDLPTTIDGSPELVTELAVAEWELDQSRARVIELELSVLREIERSTKATEALIAIGPAAVPLLTDALSDANPEIRRWAATALGQMGADAGEAIDRLREVMRDTDADVASAARQAVDQIEGRF